MPFLRYAPRMLGLTLLMMAVLVSGCGFTPRGQNLGLPFKSIVVEGNQGTAAEVLQVLRNKPGLTIANRKVDAAVVLTILSAGRSNSGGL